MNQDTLKGNWKQFTGMVKEQWGKLTNDDLTEAEGNLEKLSGKIQKYYGISKEEANDQLDKLTKKIKSKLN